MTKESTQNLDVFSSLLDKMNSYSSLSDETWLEMAKICEVVKVKKKQNLVSIGDQSDYFYFVYQGLFRLYMISGIDAKEVTKIFFKEGSFPASITSLLKQEPSDFCIEALEDSIVLKINHAKYRELLGRFDDLKMYHILYLEKHWVLEKEPQEIALLEKDAKQRYLDFKNQYPEIELRVSLQLIASRLGISPTQLSRIRKELK